MKHLLLRKFIFIFCLAFPFLSASTINEKVIICGIVKNAEKAIPNTIRSAESLGACFSDYRIIVYEDNSSDQTPILLNRWAQSNSRVCVISEIFDRDEMGQNLPMGKTTNIGIIARARNKVLDVILRDDLFGDYKYVIIADLDFYRPWDIKNILDTILHPQAEWDAVFGNGFYDHLAFRSPEFPISFELIGHEWSTHLDELRARLNRLRYYDPKGPWRKVYSAFGGIGIYKRASIKGCRYSEVVTHDIEFLVSQWIEQAKPNTFLLSRYQQLLASSMIIDLYSDRMTPTERLTYPETLGIRLFNQYGLGKVVWFSCKSKYNLPLTCEHVPFHASMIRNGHDKLFINPKICSNPAR